jgi:DNA (cytosine-5)-methyltransferase 1
MGFGRVLGDLAECGYDAEWGVLSAAGVGAPHLRKRVFIIAYSESEQIEREGSRRFQSEPSQCGEKVAHPSRELLDRSGRERDGRPEPSNGGWWAIEPKVGRMANGAPSRVDRLKCLGNAVVPRVAQKIGKMIFAYDKKNIKEKFV